MGIIIPLKVLLVSELSSARCPACGAPELAWAPDGRILCDYCGTQVRDGLTICQACGKVNPQEQEHCWNCAEPLTIVARVLGRPSDAFTPHWLQQARSMATDLKDSAETASRDRLADMDAIDRRRIERETSQAALQRVRDQQVMAGAAIVVLILLAGFAALAVAFLR